VPQKIITGRRELSDGLRLLWSVSVPSAYSPNPAPSLAPSSPPNGGNDDDEGDDDDEEDEGDDRRRRLAEYYSLALAFVPRRLPGLTQGTVEFSLVWSAATGPGNTAPFGWAAVAMRSSNAMVASAPAIIVQSGTGSVGAYAITGKTLSSIVPMPAANSPISGVSFSRVSTSATDEFVARWSRPLIAASGSVDVNIEPSTPTGLIVAAGPTRTLDIHSVTAFVPDLLLVRQCSTANCPASYGRCADARGFGPCLCHIGRTGDDCSSCANGFSGSNCDQMGPAYLNAIASGALTFATGISLLRSIDVTAAVAGSLGVPLDRVNVTFSVGATDSQTLATVIIGAPSSATAPSAAALMSTLQTLVANPTSTLYLSPSLAALDSNAMMSATVKLNGLARTYAHHVSLNPRLSISWSIETVSGMGPVAYFAVSYYGDPRWFGIGFGDVPMMIGSDAIAFEPTSAIKVRQWILTAKEGAMQSCNPSNLIPSESEVIDMGNGQFIGTFARPLSAGAYKGAMALEDGPNTFVWAYGRWGKLTMSKHSDDDAGAGTLDLRKGTYKAIQPGLMKIHGIIMFVCWAVLVPAGIFAARFFKHAWPNTGPSARWFVVHRWVQSGSGILLVVGFALGVIVSGSGSHFTNPHGIIGLTVFLLGILQPINAAFRPPKAPSTTKRTAWEWTHKIGGYGSVLLAAANIYIGLRLVHSMRYIVIYSVFLGFCAILFYVFQTGCLKRFCAGGSVEPVTTSGTSGDNGIPINPAISHSSMHSTPFNIDPSLSKPVVNIMTAPQPTGGDEDPSAPIIVSGNFDRSAVNWGV
jgi:hypothetical protein